MVHLPGLSTPTLKAQAQLLAGELRAHKPHNMARDKIKKKKGKENKQSKPKTSSQNKPIATTTTHIKKRKKENKQTKPKINDKNKTN